MQIRVFVRPLRSLRPCWPRRPWPKAMPRKAPKCSASARRAMSSTMRRTKSVRTWSGIIDRPIATRADGFKYSKAMIEFGADGKVWDVETLTLYLKKPKDLIKGTKMAFAGLEEGRRSGKHHRLSAGSGFRRIGFRYGNRGTGKRAVGRVFRVSDRLLIFFQNVIPDRPGT